MQNPCGIKSAIVNTAITEEALWTDSSGNKIRENDPSMLSELERYWNAVPGINAKNLAARSAADLEAWSAAFICSVYSDGGITVSDGFEFARRHIIYIVGALRNRENSDTTKPIWLYDKVEIMLEAQPQKGDLICFNRFDDQRVYSNHSYTSLRATYANNNTLPSGVSHCSVVAAIAERNGVQIIETISGNMDGSVRYTFLSIQNGQFMEVDKQGNNPRPNDDIFGVIKITECPDF